MTDLIFEDIEPVVVPVQIGGGKYELHEASAADAAKYRNAVMKATTLGPDGKPQKIDGLADAEPLLVSLCLRNCEHGKRVSLGWVQNLPSRVVQALYKKCKEISELEMDEDEDESKDQSKNELSDTETSSE